MITLTNLETFLWVVRLGGFGNAAKRLNTTQSAISQRIAVLERALGTSLLERQSRNIMPTQTGAELIPYAEKMLGLRAEILRAIATPETYRGHVRLGVSETIAYTCLVDVVRTMQKSYPSVTIDIEVDVSTTLRDALLQGDLDIIIPSMPILEPNVRNVNFVDYSLAWVASRLLPLPENDITLRDIATYPILTYPKNTRPYQEIRDMFLRADITDFKIYGNTSLSAISRLCAGGIGIAVIPTEVVVRELAQDEMRILPVVDGALPDLRFTLSYVLTPDTQLLDTLVQSALNSLPQDA